MSKNYVLKINDYELAFQPYFEILRQELVNYHK